MAWYNAGTVAVTNGSANVVGTGTQWIANAQVGDFLRAPDGLSYEILSVVSDTSLTIGPNYAGATASGQAYRIAPTQGHIPTLNASVNALIGQFGGIRDGIGAGLFPDGTAAAPALRFGADGDTGLFRPGSNSLGIAVGGNERVTVASTGSITVKLRTDAYAALNLDTERVAGEGGITLRFRDADGVKGYFGYSTATDVLYVVNQANADLAFSTNNATRMVLQSNGVLRPSADNAYALGLDTHRWVMTHSNVVVVGVGSAANPSIRFNTDTDTGLYRQAADTLGFACGGVAKLVLETVVLRPGADNVQNFGWSGGRWMNIYAVNGTINTSDAREKTWRGPMSAAERTAARRIVAELGFFQWNDAIAEKGEDGARMHFGVRAQAVWDIMADEGLIDPIAEDETPSSKYAFLCYDEWAAVAAVAEVRDEDDNIVTPAEPERPAGNRFGIRADQLAMFLIAAQEARLAALEAAAS